ncbi:YchJ family protein [Gordonia effusa]|nr:YchJ family metal-binding protein [Gordonia effusa]
MTSLVPGDRCPCGSGEVFGDCCRPLLAGAPAPTAERLMRSRYTAFVVDDAEYLLETWHRAKRPSQLVLDDELTWRRLDVLATQHGGPFDTTGMVEFEAFYRGPDGRGSLHERSRFVKQGRDWFYVDGTALPSS